MLVNPTNEIVRDANIKRSAWSAGEDANPIAHPKMIDCRVKPGNDEFLLAGLAVRMALETRKA